MNILICHRDGRLTAKITDFGLSKSALSKQSKSSGEGTAAYKAPEEDVSSALDMFSFGGLLVFMFGEHHKHPFTGLGDHQINKRMIKFEMSNQDVEVPELEEVGDEYFQDCARKCFRLDPSKRPTAQQLLDEFMQRVNMDEKAQVKAEIESSIVPQQNTRSVRFHLFFRVTSKSACCRGRSPLALASLAVVHSVVLVGLRGTALAAALLVSVRSTQTLGFAATTAVSTAAVVLAAATRAAE